MFQVHRFGNIKVLRFLATFLDSRCFLRWRPKCQVTWRSQALKWLKCIQVKDIIWTTLTGFRLVPKTHWRDWADKRRTLWISKNQPLWPQPSSKQRQVFPIANSSPNVRSLQNYTHITFSACLTSWNKHMLYISCNPDLCLYNANTGLITPPHQVGR